MIENLEELIFCCNFCGGDHGSTECEEMICTDCGKMECDHDYEDKITIFEAIEMITDDIWELVPAEDSDNLYEQYGDDLPIELIAHVVAKYPIPPEFEYLIKQFPSIPPDDGRIWNRSRKFGACYQFAYEAQHYNTAQMQELVGSEEEVILVQGYIRMTEDYIGHAWVEVGDFVIDCGSHENKFVPIKREEYHTVYSVKYPNRYTAKESLQKINQTGHWGSWSETPGDIPLKEIS
ncbi:hypothetical protein [uncultured Rubinisphaera sp.]|tara:strand:- start:1796 stop:2500 length:705 start_codon:yes stop_codon:yes gene_type:complete